MSERPLSPHCKTFLDVLKQRISENDIRTNNLGVAEGCIVDIRHKGLTRTDNSRIMEIQDASSIWINAKGNPSGELMIPQCRTPDTGLSFLLTVGMELCSPGCRITQVHNHHGKIATTHVHFECDMEKQPNKRYCVEEIARTVVKLNEYINKTCR